MERGGPSLGPNRILFATDYPFAPATKGAARHFMEAAYLNEADRTKIASGNWQAVCANMRR